MSIVPQPLIRFQLVEMATGEPYQNSSCSSVLRSSLVVPVVDQFRDAVKLKCSNKLASVDAGDLVVYKNKAAFDKRKTMLDDEKEEPLKASCVLDGLGKTDEDEDMLVVVVPSSEKYRLCLKADGSVGISYERAVRVTKNWESVSAVTEPR
jgi:hypothetical protein